MTHPTNPPPPYPKCPVCGFDPATLGEGVFEAWDICPCCGTEFGYHDANRPHMELRRLWMDRGGKWWSAFHSPPPAGWDWRRQVDAMGIEE